MEWIWYIQNVGWNGSENKKCETPTIAFNEGKLTFACATDDVEYISEVTSADLFKEQLGHFPGCSLFISRESEPGIKES